MNNLDTIRLSILLSNALLIAFNGVFRTFLGLSNPLTTLPFIAIASALLVGAILAEHREQPVLFWAFSAGCLITGLGF